MNRDRPHPTWVTSTNPPSRWAIPTLQDVGNDVMTLDLTANGVSRLAQLVYLQLHRFFRVVVLSILYFFIPITILEFFCCNTKFPNLSQTIYNPDFSGRILIPWTWNQDYAPSPQWRGIILCCCWDNSDFLSLRSQALIHGLNRHYYSITINYRKNELEQKVCIPHNARLW